jgi:hypothetical protein
VLGTNGTSVTLYLGVVLTVAAGWLCLAVALRRVTFLPRLPNWVASAALVVVASGLFVPQTSGTYATGIALVVANWSIGSALLTEGTAAAATPGPTDELASGGRRSRLPSRP